MNDILKKTFSIGDGVAEKLGFFLVDAEYITENGTKVLRLYIDRDGGITIDECEMFSREFEAEFDIYDPIDEPYSLEVSSPGADRILKTEREFLYYIGRNVSVKLYAAVDGMKEFDGVLERYVDNNITVNSDGKSVKFALKEAVYVRLAFKM